MASAQKAYVAASSQKANAKQATKDVASVNNGNAIRKVTIAPNRQASLMKLLSSYQARKPGDVSNFFNPFPLTEIQSYSSTLGGLTGSMYSRGSILDYLA